VPGGGVLFLCGKQRRLYRSVANVPDEKTP
jgi:hypothetical protein